MGRLGISIYVDKSNEEELKDYIDRAAKNGFSRIFSCLLSVDDDRENILNKFKAINEYAHSKGFEIILDVNPKVFDELGISYDDLTFFKESGSYGIRLDMGFTGLEESLMTFNPHNLKIEINMSDYTKYIDTIMDYQPKKENIIGCHNFYPNKNSGLTLEHFIKCSDKFKKYGLKTASFVTSQNENTFGPWPVTEGLPTLEVHRSLPLDVQVKHLIALGNIDDIIISNCYPSDEELEKVGSMRKDVVTFDIELIENLPYIERDIVLKELHFNRGDVSSNMIRSIQSRSKYKDYEFEIFNTPQIIKRGDVLIESDKDKNYVGELQVALCDMKNNGKANVVGHIREDEIFILDFIKPWQKFTFRSI